jgi:predicted metal-dependent HD superfamily phosphohydrolase
MGRAGFLDEWDRLAEAVGLDPAVGRDLEARHREPQRHYHTVEHIEAVIGHLDTLDARTPTTLLAAFFHDAIYDPTRADNEARSADLAAESLDGFDEVDDVVAIVLATAGHALMAGAPAGTAAFLDADLAILGADEATYDRYAEAIAAEYAHVPIDEFGPRRAQVLAGFLDRPTLYFTEAGRNRWEARARANLTREIERLG